MVYLEHGPEYGAYLITIAFYYIGGLGIILYGAYLNRNYLLKKEFKFTDIRGGLWPFFKRFLPWLLIGLLVWSVSAFKATDYYLSLYSFTMTETHLTSTEVFEDMKVDEFYRFDIEGIQKLGAPSSGLLKGYKLLDSKREGLIVRRVDQVVIAQGYLFLPVVKLHIYEVEGKQVKELRTAYLFYPQSPGGRLSELFDFPFEMFFWGGGGVGP
ncbi:hypothetical protein E3E22_07950 [Thermococcus sp. MV5]|uniref:hypothetical protein n=1 Tax=Thermococcus sp. MV5 TaxID=1638272 RepID=UPI00143933EA|nr:hypothetical protein [Thermococcus sp. MV5]NJE26546.1 hypothetical protein [Thermococcus sp. MV5]